jgi:hypothetical protein
MFWFWNLYKLKKHVHVTNIDAPIEMCVNNPFLRIGMCNTIWAIWVEDQEFCKTISQGVTAQERLCH